MQTDVQAVGEVLSEVLGDGVQVTPAPDGGIITVSLSRGFVSSDGGLMRSAAKALRAMAGRLAMAANAADGVAGADPGEPDVYQTQLRVFGCEGFPPDIEFLIWNVASNAEAEDRLREALAGYRACGASAPAVV